MLTNLADSHATLNRSSGRGPFSLYLWRGTIGHIPNYHEGSSERSHIHRSHKVIAECKKKEKTRLSEPSRRPRLGVATQVQVQGPARTGGPTVIPEMVPWPANWHLSLALAGATSFPAFARERPPYRYGGEPLRTFTRLPLPRPPEEHPRSRPWASGRDR